MKCNATPWAPLSPVRRASLSVVRGPGRVHLNSMSRQQFLPETPDLFGAHQSPARQRPGPTRSWPKRPGSVPTLARVPDAELAELVRDLVGELQRRAPSHKELETRPERQRVVQEAASTLARLAPSDEERRRLRADRETDEVAPTKRKAIRAALLSGVKSMQVAKHFGVPLATVHQISTGQP